MKVLVYAADPVGSEARKCFPAQVELEILSLSSLNRTLERRRADRFVYLDASNLDGPDFDDMAAAFSRREGLAWGVLDLEGAVKDPALLFFLGAADYLGPGVLPVDEERLRKALSRAHRDDEAPETEQPRSFPGWARLREGKEYSFLFCHAALGEQERLRDAIGEKRFAKLKEAFASHVAEIAAGLDGKAWIQDPTGLLLAFPPKPALDSPVLATFELLLDRALVGYEIFHLEVPATFRFAFHSGKAPWRPPGATGTVVSDDVNFIFHLATRYPHDGRVVVSSACSDAIPQQIADLFTPAPAFEGRDLSLSRRFCD